MKKDEALNVLETFLTDEQLARLKGVSAMTGAPISTLIQIAVADYEGFAQEPHHAPEYH